ncbi:DUF1524 domain-containing protein [Phycicoccus sp. Soil748]|uniref:GmrSD restriction endonuclease domain-containing protein n=1 Tax=Phycicoccus sp. Soil748 TaxID=1736397 RepID=UPI0009EC5A13|nr:DUF1524 domain-containing protein [Phycicoccus sp. Soil748]
MIHRPDFSWPTVLGPLVITLAVSGCVPASADPGSDSGSASGRSTTSSPAATRALPASDPSTTEPVAEPAASSEPAGTATSTTSTPAPSPSPTSVRPGTAVTTLAAIPVKGRAPRTGYDRAEFGQAWADVDRNGCDTRNDILRRDLRQLVLKAGTRGCLVLRGTLHDPYTGTTIRFVRGQSTSTAVQIDHVVALSDAWQKGAQKWTSQQRTAFANDPLNLLAVDGPSNQRKSDGDAATWLPPRKATRCSYVARQVAVKRRYGLWVTSAERAAILRVLDSCPTQGLPSGGVVRLGGGTVEAVAPAPTRSTAPKPSVAPPAASATDPRFGTCREANAAGYGPYRRGVDPEYDWYQDRDHDGLVCER